MSRRSLARAAPRPPPPEPLASDAEARGEGETSAPSGSRGPHRLRAAAGDCGAIRAGDPRACAAAANSRSSRRRAPRSAVQCQSRPGCTKKRLKAECSKKPPSQCCCFSTPPGLSASNTGHVLHVKAEELDEEVIRCEPAPKRRRTSSEAGGGWGQVVAAVEKLAEVYERVGSARQREAAQLEMRRLEAMRDLEIERMRLLVELAVSTAAMRCRG